jgi:hypothetical protein
VRLTLQRLCRRFAGYQGFVGCSALLIGFAKTGQLLLKVGDQSHDPRRRGGCLRAIASNGVSRNIAGRHRITPNKYQLMSVCLRSIRLSAQKMRDWNPGCGTD